jgi:arsenate reductase
MAEPICVLFNPSCSKCRGVRQALEERGDAATYVHYLEEVPSREELEAIIRKLGIASPREMMRTSEPIYQELGLADADDERLLSAMVSHPILIERPIVIRGERAVIARPVEKALELLGDSGEPRRR